MLTHQMAQVFTESIQIHKICHKKIINMGKICQQIMLTHKKLYRKLYPDTLLSKTKKNCHT